MQICAKIMEQGIVPPTINLDNPDLEAGCDLDYVPNVAHKFAPEDMPTAVLSDNLGFGTWIFVLCTPICCVCRLVCVLKIIN